MADVDAPLSQHLDPEFLATLWDFGDPAASESRFREELARRDPDAVSAAELTTQLARSLGLQGRLEAADALLDTIGSDAPIVRARLNLERGRVRNSGGDRKAAIPFFEQALTDAGTAGDDFLAGDAIHMLAIADQDRVAMWVERGVAQAEAASDPRAKRWAGALHNNYGWTLHDAGDYSAALTQFEEALAVYEAVGSRMDIHIAHWAIARCLRSLGRYDEALAIQLRLAENEDRDTYVDEEIAELRKLLAES